MRWGAANTQPFACQGTGSDGVLLQSVMEFDDQHNHAKAIERCSDADSGVLGRFA